MTHKALKAIIFGMTRGDGELLFEWLRARIWSKKKIITTAISLFPGLIPPR